MSSKTDVTVAFSAPAPYMLVLRETEAGRERPVALVSQAKKQGDFTLHYCQSIEVAALLELVHSVNYQTEITNEESHYESLHLLEQKTAEVYRRVETDPQR